MFYAAKEFDAELEDVMAALLQHLKGGGYVIVADINVKNILKNALNFDFKNYHILEVCNPSAAREIIGKDDLNGMFVPCKLLIFQEGEKTKIRLLKATKITDHLYPQASEVLKSYERELFSLVDGFSV